MYQNRRPPPPLWSLRNCWVDPMQFGRLILEVLKYMGLWAKSKWHSILVFENWDLLKQKTYEVMNLYESLLIAILCCIYLVLQDFGT